VAGKQTEVSTPLLENILNQPNSLLAIADHQCGKGRDALVRAAAMIRSKKRVVLTGMGASFFGCMGLQYGLASLGVHAVAVETGELLYFLQSLIDSNTAVVLVSRSGESIEVTKLLDDLRARGAALIGVVNVAESALSRSADVTILMGSATDQMVAVQTYTGTLATMGLLEAAVASELDEARSELDGTASVLSRWIPECISASVEWRSFLESASPLYLLGRGPALSTVTEGVLLMQETAKVGVVGMSIPQFRHGPVEVVSRAFRGIIIATQAETLSFDGALARDIAKMGGQVRWIGPAVPGDQIEELCPWPAQISKRFASIVEVVPLQMAAYRRAEWGGVRPGEFRWAILVTRSEAGFSGV
jgi:glutamine---fructose-6-phosphate transaminase (isomerizing)